MRQGSEWPYRCHHIGDLPLDWKALLLCGKQYPIPFQLCLDPYSMPLGNHLISLNLSCSDYPVS